MLFLYADHFDKRQIKPKQGFHTSTCKWLVASKTVQASMSFHWKQGKDTPFDCRLVQPFNVFLLFPGCKWKDTGQTARLKGTYTHLYGKIIAHRRMFMERMAKFHKVSFQRFEKDWKETFPKEPVQEIRVLYDNLRLPKRATRGSAGYDFFAPAAFTLAPQETIKLPTGIRAEIREGWVLQLFPRSSLGFRYRLQCNNTVGIIDSDYFESDNEGHIFIKLMNDSRENKTVTVQAGEGFAQGIFLPFGICEDDDAQDIRNGGFGSTNK